MSSESGTGGVNRSHTGDSQAEIRFLLYRLEVVASWPESARKRALLEGIVLRLKTMGVAAPSFESAPKAGRDWYSARRRAARG